MPTPEAFIVSRARTPVGAFNGMLSTVPAAELGATCIRAVLDRAGVAGEDVDGVIMGNVIGAGLGQNPARQASLKAGLPSSVGATTVNKVCGSGLKAVMLAAQSIRVAEHEIVVAGGMESMSLAPYLLPKARQGYRMGNGELVDAMLHDGLLDAYSGTHMGRFGEQSVTRFHLTRQQQDDFAVRSYRRARSAAAEGMFDEEIVPVEVPQGRASVLVSADEEPTRFDEPKLRALRPVFDPEGTITAGNASSINDGGAAVLVMSGEESARRNIKPSARIAGYATFSTDPAWFSVAPLGALKRLFDQLQWTVADTDLFEINEAFAAVTMVTIKELQIPPEKVNIYGGAVALGHPIGASGARILVTLLSGLQHTRGRRGIACLCIGGGEAVAVAVERV